MQELTIQQFTALIDSINREGIDNTMWTIISATKGVSSDNVIGGTSDIKLDDATYLAVWSDEPDDQWLYFSNAIATNLFNEQYAIINNANEAHKFAKIYLFKLYKE